MSLPSKVVDRHIIWGNVNLDIDDWRDDLKSDYPDITEDEMYEKMYEINEEYLEDERTNLNIQLSQPILVIADLGLWYGRRGGYAVVESGNIRDCLYTDRDIEMVEWYVDRYGDLRADAIHHDGTNYLLYRVYKDGVTQIQRENLENKIYSGRATRADISRVTRRLGDEIAKVYGFPIPKIRTRKEEAR